MLYIGDLMIAYFIYFVNPTIENNQQTHVCCPVIDPILIATQSSLISNGHCDDLHTFVS